MIITEVEQFSATFFVEVRAEWGILVHCFSLLHTAMLQTVEEALTYETNNGKLESSCKRSNVGQQEQRQMVIFLLRDKEFKSVAQEVGGGDLWRPPETTGYF